MKERLRYFAEKWLLSVGCLQVFILLNCCLLSSCYDHVETSTDKLLVVEGWIDAGDFPKVKLTNTVYLSKNELMLDSLSNYLERWAKVTISDGTRTEIMVGRYDRNYFPPFVYTTYDMRGEIGKEYTLRVETPDGKVAEATTTIPEPVVIDSFHVEQAMVDSLYQIYAYTSCKQRCKLFSQVIGKDKEFLSAELGLMNAGMIGAEGKVSVRRGRSNLIKKRDPYFREGETVRVKFATLDSTSYEYWRSFEDLAALSRVPLVPVSTNLKSNVRGALGYWCGYGATFYRVQIPKKENGRKVND